jgi:hypothetical protein
MKRKFLIFLFLLGALFLSACGTEGRYQVTLITEGHHQLSGTTFGDLVILGGEATLEPGAVLEGSAHVISGAFTLDGAIGDDLSILGGEVTLGSQAQIGGDLNIGGGDLTNLEQAKVVGKINTGTGIQLPSFAPQPSQDIGGQIFRSLLSAVLMGLGALLVERYRPAAADRVRESATQHALVSLAMGLLVGVVALTLVVLMAYTILLIPVALLGIAIIGIALMYGWIVYGVALGRFVAQRLKLKLSAWQVVFGGTFIFMLLISLITEIPIVGGLIGILIASAALGAVFLTRFGLRRFIPETVKSERVS